MKQLSNEGRKQLAKVIARQLRNKRLREESMKKNESTHDEVFPSIKRPGRAPGVLRVAQFAWLMELCARA